jgi:hypothetical protein
VTDFRESRTDGGAGVRSVMFGLCSPRREPETPEVQMTKSQHGVKTRPKFNYAGWVEHARLLCQSLSLRTMVRVRVSECGHGVRVVVDCHVLASSYRAKRACLLKRVWLLVWCVSCRVMSCRVLCTCMGSLAHRSAAQIIFCHRCTHWSSYAP